jgi:hypothetical protein
MEFGTLARVLATVHQGLVVQEEEEEKEEEEEEEAEPMVTGTSFPCPSHNSFWVTAPPDLVSLTQEKFQQE